MHQELAKAQRKAEKLLLGAIGSMIVISGCLLLLAMVYLREDSLQSAARFTETVSRLITTQVTGTLQTVDQGLHLTATALESSTPLNDVRVAKLFNAQIKKLPFLNGLWLLDARGQVQFGSTAARLSANVTDFYTYFAANRDSDFMVAKPFLDANAKWQIHIARPLRGSNGAVRQVLVTSIYANYFETVWRDVDLGTDGSVSLMGKDGTMYSRSPFVEQSMSKNYKDRPIFSTMLPESEEGEYRDKSSVDGVERWFAYHAVPQHNDLVIIAGQTITHALDRWNRWAYLVSMTWFFGALITLGLGLLALRGMRKKNAAEMLSADTQGRYQALFSDALDAILLADPHGKIYFANRAACEMLGHTEESIRLLGRGGLLDPQDERVAIAIATRNATNKFRGELTFVRKDGSKFEGDISTNIHRESSGEAKSTIIFRDVTERNRAQAQLAESAEKMQELTRRVIQAQEDERARIARELHDELGQSLTAIKINLQSGTHFKGQDPEELNLENIRIVEDVLQQVRQIAAALRPSVLDNLGLVPALGWLGKQSAKRAGVTFSCHTTPLETRLTPEMETTCFRIAQEAITNTMRHAQAKHLTIRLELAAAQLVMEVEDDGVGMDWEYVRSKPFSGRDLGTTGMAERAALIGGRLEIRSAPGSGCTVIFRCPLKLAPET